MHNQDLGQVLTSADFIHENSQHVFIPSSGIESAAKVVFENMKTREYSTKTWKMHPLNPKVANESAINWIFLVDLLNFSFWSERDPDDKSVPNPARYAVEYQGVKYTGYWALCACINRACQEGYPILKPQWWAKDASDDVLLHVFRSDTEEQMPMVKERIRVMREDGGALLKYYDGTFINCIKEANGSAMKLLQIITRHFKSFNDEHTFHLRKVQIFKRAQILIADIWACFDGQGLGYFEDIDQITMFADYRVPQALYHLGCLEYSKDLIQKLRDHQNFPSGCSEEVEIRGNSIWAVELLRQRIQHMIDEQNSDMKVNAILLDFYIWDYAKEIQGTVDIPTHRTRSVYY
ncbi:hypothetical protein K450DRAFT_274173 [Umbelopsis ramanniana AG]|uniref:Queuosine 5'-phosphate N-glycosylase/hydrolase n=1 Tax=Umbelopsis ramanniana AG TaxID=1314678 RepID=A0AAD5E631_UMBRA|nr:uncharacterized protein K450DRAFT_274173 [Umbelopsis ramanniana AG]KAI8577001.1 hypothetical protein K450DRAFT_274173 [Umbelopsis ramanniana AG]